MISSISTFPDACDTALNGVSGVCTLRIPLSTVNVALPALLSDTFSDRISAFRWSAAKSGSSAFSSVFPSAESELPSAYCPASDPSVVLSVTTVTISSSVAGISSVWLSVSCIFSDTASSLCDTFSAISDISIPKFSSDDPLSGSVTASITDMISSICSESISHTCAISCFTEDILNISCWKSGSTIISVRSRLPFISDTKSARFCGSNKSMNVKPSCSITDSISSSLISSCSFIISLMLSAFASTCDTTSEILSFMSDFLAAGTLLSLNLISE